MFTIEDLAKANQDLLEKSKEKPTPNERDSETREKIAKRFLWGYFFSIAGAWLTAMIYNLWVVSNYCLLAAECAMLLDLKEVLLVVSGIIGPPLGFVMGYYFKSQE